MEAALGAGTNSGQGTHSTREPPSHSSPSPEDGRGHWGPLGKWPRARIGCPAGSPGPSLSQVTLQPVRTWPVLLGMWPPFSKDTMQGRVGGAPCRLARSLPRRAFWRASGADVFLCPLGGQMGATVPLPWGPAGREQLPFCGWQQAPSLGVSRSSVPSTRGAPARGEEVSFFVLVGTDPGAVEAELRLTRSWAEAGLVRMHAVPTAGGMWPPLFPHPTPTWTGRVLGLWPERPEANIAFSSSAVSSGPSWNGRCRIGGRAEAGPSGPWLSELRQREGKLTEAAPLLPLPTREQTNLNKMNNDTNPQPFGFDLATWGTAQTFRSLPCPLQYESWVLRSLSSRGSRHTDVTGRI